MRLELEARAEPSRLMQWFSPLIAAAYRFMLATGQRSIEVVTVEGATRVHLVDHRRRDYLADDAFDRASVFDHIRRKLEVHQATLSRGPNIAR